MSVVAPRLPGHTLCNTSVILSFVRLARSYVGDGPGIRHDLTGCCH